MEPLATLDRQMVKLWNRSVTKVLVQCVGTTPEDATWELWFAIQQHYLDFGPS